MARVSGMKRTRDVGVVDALLELKKAKKAEEADTLSTEHKQQQSTDISPVLKPQGSALAQSFIGAIDTAVRATVQACSNQLFGWVQRSGPMEFNTRFANLGTRIQTLHALESVLKMEVTRKLVDASQPIQYTPSYSHDASILAVIRPEVKRSGAKAVASMLKLMASLFDSIVSGSPLGIALGPIEHSLSNIFSRLRTSMKAKQARETPKQGVTHPIRGPSPPTSRPASAMGSPVARDPFHNGSLNVTTPPGSGARSSSPPSTFGYLLMNYGGMKYHNAQLNSQLLNIVVPPAGYSSRENHVSRSGLATPDYNLTTAHHRNLQRISPVQRACAVPPSLQI